jgi:hypothetical protein
MAFERILVGCSALRKTGLSSRAAPRHVIVR